VCWLIGATLDLQTGNTGMLRNQAHSARNTFHTHILKVISKSDSSSGVISNFSV